MARKNKTFGMAGAAVVGILVLLLAGTERGHVQTRTSNGADKSTHTPESPDYMNARLRARVNQLKADVAREPTTRSTATERADVLWTHFDEFVLRNRTFRLSGTTVVSFDRVPWLAPSSLPTFS